MIGISPNDYGVRIVVAYENKRVGQIIFPPGVERQRLIQGGFAKKVEPEHEPVAEKIVDTMSPRKKARY